MIPSDFRDYFVNSSSRIQQEIVSSLLTMSLQESEITDSKETKAFKCPLVAVIVFVQMANLKAYRVMFVMVAKRILARLLVSFGLLSRKKKEVKSIFILFVIWL